MSHLTGEYDCKLDSNRRLAIPVALKKKLPDLDGEGLVVNRGFKRYLVIYTKKEWDKKLDELDKLNQYETKNIDFIRSFTRGASELLPDSSGRVNLPQSLLDYAGIKMDVVLNCQISKIELWDKTAYQAMIESELEDDFARKAEEVMGSKGKEAAQ